MNGAEPAVVQPSVNGWAISWNPDDGRWYVEVPGAPWTAVATFKDRRKACNTPESTSRHSQTDLVSPNWLMSKEKAWPGHRVGQAAGRRAGLPHRLISKIDQEAKLECMTESLGHGIKRLACANRSAVMQSSQRSKERTAK